MLNIKRQISSDEKGMSYQSGFIATYEGRNKLEAHGSSIPQALRNLANKIEDHRVLDGYMRNFFIRRGTKIEDSDRIVIHEVDKGSWYYEDNGSTFNGHIEGIKFLGSEGFMSNPPQDVIEVYLERRNNETIHSLES